MLLGVLFVYSATMVSDSALSAPLYRQKWLLQLVWYVIGIGAASILCCISYQTLARWGTVLIIVGVLLDPLEGGTMKVPDTLAWYFQGTGTAMALLAAEAL